ncbi:unnamed protein product [Urochloa decumbens]|uniref:Uncharacterized protein n=1 Tax=Urochloa decumbens TaxID=240449 RepID=A0ABC9BTL1_9POAL
MNDAATGATAQEIVIAMEDRMHKTRDRIESRVATMQSRIHRFPRGLRGIGGDGEDGHYIVPSVVAIGPYHHGLPHLQEMEDVKHAAAYHFCSDAGRSTMEVYERILSLAGDARHCYATDTDDEAVARLSDAELAAMLLLDGCFLLQYMINSDAPMFFAGPNLPSGEAILKDMMLLENQIPWLVLDALTDFLSVDVRQFVGDIGDTFFPKERPGWMARMFQMTCRRIPAETQFHSQSTISYKPAHLLGLLRFSQSQLHSMPSQDRWYQGSSKAFHLMKNVLRHGRKKKVSSKALRSTSAVELAQIGVKLTTSKATWLGDMTLRKNLFFGELSLSPLFLNDVTACWLVNMAALEASTAWDSDGFVVSSYLSVLAMLMDREEDVHHLRAKGLLRSIFSNARTMDFFKGLAQHLRLGGRQVILLDQIESYKRSRPLRIFLHRRIYGSYKTMTIASLFSIVGVLVGIFKTLLSKKQQ